MNYTSNCSHCGHQITAYSHSLNAPLVQALEQLNNFYFLKKRGCNLQKDLTLTKNQYNNFQKLQYFGLVARTENGWLPTQLGSNFLRGGVAVVNPVATFGKEILESMHEAWKTSKKKPSPVHISQIKNYTWKGREAYKEEKRVTLFA